MLVDRSPRADPSLRGMVSGLTLEGSIDDLAVLYLAAIQARTAALLAPITIAAARLLLSVVVVAAGSCIWRQAHR